MAGDVFTIDAKSFETASVALQSMEGSTTRTKKQMQELASAMDLFARTQASMGESTLVDPKASKKLEELQKQLTAVGVTKQKIAAISGKEVTDYSKLSMLEQRRVRMATQAEGAKKRMVMHGNRMVEMQAKQNRLSRAGNTLLRRGGRRASGMARGAAGYASSLTGVHLSLLGILALLLRAVDENNKLSATAKQISMQWGKSNKNIGTANAAMDVLTRKYHQSVDASMALAGSLANVGIEQKDMVATMEDLIAAQYAYGIGIQENRAQMGELTKGLGLTNKEATDFLNLARETSKTIPHLSMSEVSQDMTELVAATRSYNGDLLGTLSLYNTLMRKDIAKELGLGDAPQQVRKEIVKTVSGFSQELGDGWKAALGEGASIAGRILDFEAMAPVEQFERMAEVITKKTSQYSGETREFAVRELLKQFGFTTKEVRDTLAGAFADGGFSAEGLKGMTTAVNTQREKFEKLSKGADKQRAELLTAAKKISKGLMSWQQKMSNAISLMMKIPEIKELREAIDDALTWFKAHLQTAIPDLINAIKGMSAWYKKWFGSDDKDQKMATAALNRTNKHLDASAKQQGKTVGQLQQILAEQTSVYGVRPDMSRGAETVSTEKVTKTAQRAFLTVFEKMQAEGKKEEATRFKRRLAYQFASAEAGKGSGFFDKSRQVRFGALTGPGGILDQPASQVLPKLSSVALSRISAKETFRGVSEVEYLIKAVVENNMQNLVDLMTKQLKEKRQMTTGVKALKGSYKSATDMTGAVNKTETAMAAATR